MAKSAEEFERKLREREFPTCPPRLEQVLGKQRFTYFDKERQVWLPHHAAVFGLVRWTNLYFPCRAVVQGDLVGGALAPVFGPGVRDVAVSTGLKWESFTHTAYWELGKGGNHLRALRTALNLDFGESSTGDDATG